MISEDEALIEKAQRLAVDCKKAGVSKNHIQQILAHLQKRQNVSATLKLLDDLQTSCFAKRSNSTKRQLEGLRTYVGQELRGQRDWRRGARLLGWTCRCLEAMRYRPGW